MWTRIRRTLFNVFKCIQDSHHKGETTSGISGFLLSLPTVGYITPAWFQKIGFSVRPNLKLLSKTERTTSDDVLFKAGPRQK